MCLSLTVVAYDSTCRMIAQCEHGTVHMTWDIATLRLREADFMTLVGFLEDNATSEFSSVSDGWCTLECDKHRTRRLWIGQIALVATAADFDVLVSMIAEAASVIKIEPASSPGVLDFPMLTVDTATLAIN